MSTEPTQIDWQALMQDAFRQANQPATQEDPIDGVLAPTAEQAACLQDLEALQEKKRNPHKEYVQRLRANLPQALLTEKRFVRYYLGAKDTAHGSGKIPRGSVSDPSSWSSFDECVASLTPKDEGVGFVFTGSDVHGLDLDHVRNAQTGEICPEAKVLLTRFNSWAEVSISGTGLHILFTTSEEITRYKKLGADHAQYWHPKHSPRFFALTGDLVPGYNTLNEGRKAFLMVGGTLAHTNARLREELQDLDPEQCAKLPSLQYVQELTEPKEKTKNKTRKVLTGFTIKDYLAFNKLQVINECDNELGHCVRVASCPIKGDAHATHNDTTCNFIFPAKDGGLAFHCQSSGCSEKSIHDVIKVLAELNGVYEKGIYEDRPTPTRKDWTRTLKSHKGSEKPKTHLRYLWQDYIPLKKLIHFAGASGAGKSPVSLDLAARISSGQPWPDGTPNTMGPRTVILMCSEDDWGDTQRPRLELYGANLDNIVLIEATATKEEGNEFEVGVALKEDTLRLRDEAKKYPDLALVIIDPITNYLQGVKMNSEEEVRQVLMPLVEQFITPLNVSVITIGHLNRREKGTDAKARVMGAAAFYGVARFVYMFGPDTELEDKFAHVMVQDRGVGAQSIKYKTEAVDQTWDGETDKVVRVVWGEKCDATGQDAVDPISQEEKTQVSEDAQFLKEFLRDGAKPAQAVQQAHEQKTGRKVANWDKAKRRAKVKAQKIKGQGRSAGWEWGLLAPEQKDMEFDHNQREAVT
jgi:putative DNA primase/helicase